MQWLTDRYRKLPPRDRLMVWLLCFFTVLAGYVFWAGTAWVQLQDVRRSLNGEHYDHKKLLADMKAPQMQADISEARLAELQQEQQQYEVRLRELSGRLLPLDHSGPREHLKLELTRLAEKEQLQVVRFHTSDSALRPLPDQLVGEALRRYLMDRPVLTLDMTGHYFDLVAFLDDLQALSWQVRIGNMDVRSRTDSGELDIKLELKL